MKRLFRVEVEVEFESTTDHVLVWADTEEEAQNIAEEDADDNFEPSGIESVRAQDADEMSEAEIENERKWNRRIVNGDGNGFSWDAALEAAREEKRALEAWSAQRVLPGLPQPPLPSRCGTCGARPPLTPHAEDCHEADPVSTRAS